MALLTKDSKRLIPKYVPLSLLTDTTLAIHRSSSSGILFCIHAQTEDLSGTSLVLVPGATFSRVNFCATAPDPSGPYLGVESRSSQPFLDGYITDLVRRPWEMHYNRKERLTSCYQKTTEK